MSPMRIHTVESAPAGSQPVLEQVQAMLGAIPNLAAGMAEAPSLIRGFFGLREIYTQGTLTAQEIEALSITNARENGCNWCVAFHTRSAKGAGLTDSVITALRAGESPGDPRLGALVQFTRELIRNRGKVSSDTRKAFQAAGYTDAQALEVVLGAGFSLLANYAGHLIDPPLDEGLKRFAWSAQGELADR
jgi:AhpD family alkylhydroperoxidase